MRHSDVAKSRFEDLFAQLLDARERQRKLELAGASVERRAEMRDELHHLRSELAGARANLETDGKIPCGEPCSESDGRLYRAA